MKMISRPMVGFILFDKQLTITHFKTKIMKTLNNSLKNKVLVISTLLWSSVTFGQQQVQFTQYMYNTMSINPAYTGTGTKLEAYAIHRSQWLGISGAPSTQNFGVQGAINNKLGLGLSVVNDKIGPSNQVYVNASAAVRLKLAQKVNLSIGLNGGLDVLNVDWSKGLTNSNNDMTMQTNIRNRVRPLIGAGTYLYSDKWYFGFSSPNFVKKDEFGREDEASINSNVHWYVMGGYVMNISDNVKFKPAALVKLVTGAPVTVDLSANFMIQNAYTVGAAYRYNDAASLLLGYTFKSAFFIGYSYDITLTKLRKYNSGSHDIILKYTLFSKNQVARSPRFF